MSVPIGGGLHNLGNTCFFNAAMQCVLHSPSLALLLQSKAHSQTCPMAARQQWCAFCEMENVYARTRDVRSYAPSNMVNHLKSIFKKFRLGRQEDSHEFLRYLIEGMQESQTGKAGKDKEAHEALIRNSRIFGVFGTTMKTCVQCLGCGQTSITKHRYYDFNIVLLVQLSNVRDQIRCWKAYQLEGANRYSCESCKNRCNGRKRFLLDTTPQVVTFQFKRFTNFLRKIGKFIQYPLVIDMGKYLQQPRRVVYKLFGVIVHAGGASWSGHYYSYIRSKDVWYKMDDSYVSKCSPETALGQNAYILLYQKIEEEPAPVPTVTTITQPSPKINGSFKKSELVKEQPPKQVAKPKQTEKPTQPQTVVEKSVDDQKLQPPGELRRGRSKQQLEHTVPYQQLMLHTLARFMQLTAKMGRRRPHNATTRRVYDLRKYERHMQKKRKLG